MKLLSLNNVDLVWSKLSEGGVLTLKKGQISIGIILNPDDLDSLIEQLTYESSLMKLTSKSISKDKSKK